MKYISVDDFIKKTKGKAFDVDGKAGVQCVDGIKEFVKLVYGKADFTTGTSWAYGLWTKFMTNGCSKYFKQYPYSQAKKGDWVIWNWNSKDAKKSHVGMFIEKANGKVKVYGQNQGKSAFGYIWLSENGILGVLRPLIYVNKDNSNSFLPKRGYFKLGDKSANVGKIATFMRKTFPSYTPQSALGDYYGKHLMGAIKEFQRRTGLTPDGCVGPLTLKKFQKFGFIY